ncbi:hypothetical protein B0H14DRAFT_3558313 [Mycena olivaceomarginata]|nr:hypothetical protein B0H14DRAFT_3586652 [Mycena olivaceomarginata]KAJ7873622.1 hypothetical protein B0H14DRAFT_3558313 [Mycena olivaceomarginata]
MAMRNSAHGVFGYTAVLMATPGLSYTLSVAQINAREQCLKFFRMQFSNLVAEQRPLPPIADQNLEPGEVPEEPVGIDVEREAGICLNNDEELADVRELMADFDFAKDDENWGINVYCEAVTLLTARMQ